MKGFYIFEAETHKEAVDCLELGDIVQSHSLTFAPGTIMEEVKMHALVSKETKTKCSPDDTYDFETGALIALMKMCGVDKVVRACNEAFSEDTFKTYATKYERELNTLKKDFDKVRDLKEYYKKNYEDVKEHYDKLGDRNKYLIDDINKKLEYIKEKDEEIKKLKSDKDKSWKNYQRNIQKKQDRINELERAYKASNDDEAKLVEYYQREIKKLEAENEKLKLDCEKLQHGYNDMIFCGGRQNGKQYTFLVDLFKKIDQKKVDAAYKEAYNTALPVWQKEVLKQMYGVYKESKEKIELPRTLDINGTVYRKSIQIKDFGEQINKLTVDSLIEESRDFRQKCVDEWTKPLTKREEMWGKIIALHKKNDVIIEVKKEDVNTFLHEIEDNFPEITWLSGVKIFETKYTIRDIYEDLMTHDTIYFRLSKETKLAYSSDPDIYRYRDLEHISYLPPMRWDLFKKGRIIVGVRNNNELEEFRKEVERNTGIKNIPTCPTNLCLFYMFDKDNYKIILNSVTAANIAKINGHKVVYWENVR